MMPPRRDRAPEGAWTLERSANQRVPALAGRRSSIYGWFVQERCMKLSDFIRAYHGPIVKEREQFAATLLPAAGSMNALALRDHVEEILDAIVAHLELPQNAFEPTK
ncbi:MAG: hypothetical protein ABR567_14795 [Myxococcales bacterium]|nr:hypothetical protein [Myxococcales bacterium]